ALYDQILLSNTTPHPVPTWNSHRFRFSSPVIRLNPGRAQIHMRFQSIVYLKSRRQLCGLYCCFDLVVCTQLAGTSLTLQNGPMSTATHMMNQRLVAWRSLRPSVDQRGDVPSVGAL